MKTKTLNLSHTIQMLANIGVLGGIVFLAFELRQMNLATKLEAAERHTERANSIDRYISENPEILDDAVPRDPDYGHRLTERLFLEREVYRDWQMTFFQHQQGALDDSFFGLFQSEIQIALNAGIVNWGPTRRAQASPDFRDFMDAQKELADAAFERFQNGSSDR